MASRNHIGGATTDVLTTGGTPDIPGSGQGLQTQESDADLLDGLPGPEQKPWPTTTTAAFLKILWGEIPPGRTLVWMLPDKKSRWYVHFENIVGDMKFHEYEDVYTGVGIAPREGMRLPSNKRLKEWEVAGIAAFWADIDVAHPVHKKSDRLPPSIERALEVIAKLPFQATIIVDSGHGLQLWWALEEPWLFQDDEDRELARRACQWWHRTVKEAFAAHGWTVDSTFDLARVMRLPGTWNNKEAQDRKRVEILENPGLRYGKQQFIELIPEGFQATPMGVRRSRSANGSGFTPGSSGLALDPEAKPSSTRLDTLLKLEPRFRATWEKQRPDLTDQSPSAYDMSLANHAVRANWPDQEVANLLIAFRRRHGLDLKLREDYYEGTLDKAKRSVEEIPHRPTVDPTAETSQPEEPAGESASYPKEQRQKVLLIKDEGRNIEACVLAVKHSNNPPTFFSISDGKGIGVLTSAHGRIGMEICTSEDTHLAIARRIRFVKPGRRGAENSAVPTVTLMNLVHLALHPELPRLEGFKRMPFLWRGALVTSPGYHSESGYYVDLPAELDLSLSVESALAIIDGFFSEFPFQTPADRANAYSMILGFPLKPLGIAPGLFVDKPISQTGASLLCQCLAWVIEGRPPDIVTQGKSIGELDKRLITKLKDQPNVIILDNLTRVMDSDMVASGMTDEFFGGRLLSLNKDALVPTRSLTLMFTGNNLTSTRDLLNRCIRCRLDADHPNPETRTNFRHILPDAVADNRTVLVSAVSSIVQRWIQAGMPMGDPVLGRFIEYTRAVAGLLAFVGMPHLDGNRRQMLTEATPSWEDLNTMISKWWEKHGDKPMLATDLVDLAEELDLKGADNRSLATSLSRRLGSALGQVFEVDDEVNVKLIDSGRDEKGRAKRGLRYRLIELKSGS